MIKRLLQQKNAYFDTGALYRNKRFLAIESLYEHLSSPSREENELLCSYCAIFFPPSRYHNWYNVGNALTKVGAFFYTLFPLIFVTKPAATVRKGKTAYSWVHLPFDIRILQEHKEKDWNLVSKFQSFYGGGEGNRTPVRRPNYRIFSERSTHFGFPLPQRLRTGYGAW